MLRAVLIASLVLLGAASANADCVTSDQVKANMVTQMPGARLIAHLDSKNSEPFLASAGASTGTKLEENEALVFAATPLASLVVLFKNGCASKREMFPANMVEKWLHGLGA